MPYPLCVLDEHWLQANKKTQALKPARTAPERGQATDLVLRGFSQYLRSGGTPVLDEENQYARTISKTATSWLVRNSSQVTCVSL